MNKPLSLVIAMTLVLSASLAFAAGPGPRVGTLDAALPTMADAADKPPAGEAQTVAGKPSPYLAGALSLVVPGAGQIYNEDYLQGGLLFAGSVGCYIGAAAYSGLMYPGEKFEIRLESAILFSVGVGLHLWSIFDAITEANRQAENLDKFAIVPTEGGASVAYGFAF